MLSSAHASWKGPGAGSVLRTALLWGAAFATLELAYSTRINSMYPVGFGHVLLWLLLLVEYAAVAGVAAAFFSVTRGIWGGLAPALRLWAGPWALASLLAVSHYRDRMVIHERHVSDLAITAVIIVVLCVVLLLAARWGANKNVRASWRFLNGLGLALLAGGVIWFVAVRSPAVRFQTAEYVTAEDVGPVPDTGLRVLVIGLDGGDWKTLDPLLAQGRMPTLAGLIDRGVTARLKTVVPTYSPNLWTSISTGKTLEKHGVPSHVFAKLPLGLPSVPHDIRRIRHLTKVMKFNVRAGRRAGLLSLGIYGSQNLEARQLWDVLGDFGMRSISLEWYTTHPVSPVNGIQVSDRFHLMRGDDLRACVWPDTLLPYVKDDIVRPPDVMDRLMSMLDAQDLDQAGRDALVDRFPRVFDALSREMSRDVTTTHLVPKLFPRVPDWRFGGVYYRGMDGSHHVSWKFRDLEAGDPARDPGQRFRNLVDGYTEFCDELLRVALEPADENTVVILTSDHGWESVLWGHQRKPDGFFVMAGGPVPHSTTRGEISVYDIAPTALALLGIPVPEDMDGEVARQFIDPAFWGDYPVVTVSSYERPVDRGAEAAASAADEEILDQLRALGYVGE